MSDLPAALASWRSDPPVSLLLALGAGALTLALTPAVIALGRRYGALDRPGPRRIHRVPTPTLGGLALAIAVLGVAWLARVLPGPARGLDVRPLLGLTLASIPVLALGVTDDLREVGPWTKLAVQACAAMVLVQFGYEVRVLTNPFGPALQTGPLATPLAVAWVLLIVNAVNLVDGLDGLAAGVALIAAATLWWVGRAHGDFYVMFLASLLIGGALGFLPWNLPPARVFMGDTGSQFLGLVLAAAALLENRKETATVTLLLPLVAMGLPVADGALAFARRLGGGRPVFRPDREHVHHRLLALGLSPRAALLALWAVSAAFGLAAVALSSQPLRTVIPVVLGLGLGLFVVLEALRAVPRRRPRTEPSEPGDLRA